MICFIRAGMVAGAAACMIWMPLAGSASAETAIKEEIDAAVKFYDGVKVDAQKTKGVIAKYDRPLV